MKVFFCWSGKKSQEVATTLSSWMKQVIQAIEPWVSTETEKGTKWQQEIGDHLDEAKAGIVCLTPDNLDSNWVHFEAGALAKTTRVFTFLLNLQTTDVKNPLAWFQWTKTEEADVRKLMHDLDKLVGETEGRALGEKTVDEIFDNNWARLQEKLLQIADKQAEERAPRRPQEELLTEALEGIRVIIGSQRTSTGELQEIRTAINNLMSEDEMTGPTRPSAKTIEHVEPKSNPIIRRRLTRSTIEGGET